MGFLMNEYMEKIKPASDELARLINYKDVSGITHIIVKDGDKIEEINLKYKCWDCLKKNDYSFHLCRECQTQRTIKEIAL